MSFFVRLTIRGFFLCGAIASIAFVQIGRAQSVQTSDRADLARSQAPNVPGITPTGVPEGSAPSSPNDSDLGEQQILKRQEAYQPFTISDACPIYWTSNVALSRSHEQDDVLEAPSVGFFYQPRITPTLYGLIDVRDQQFYYDRFDELNFGAFDVDAGITWILPQLENLTLRAAYNYDRLTMKDSFASFFQNHNVIVSAELPVKFGRAQQVTFGTAATISARAIPETPRRNDYEAYVGYTVSLTRAFNVNAVGRLVVRDYYHENSRADISEILALTATYNVTRYFAASALSTFAANQSNQDVFDYKVSNLGGAVALTIKF
jgi:hypothetical protein